MGATAYQTQYRQETIKGYENDNALLRNTVTTEWARQANKAVFMVSDSNGRTATTRGSNGLIPSGSNNYDQPEVTLVEKNDLVKQIDFDIRTGQGNQSAIMQQTSRGVINRDIDQSIITQLNTGTIDTNAGTTLKLLDGATDNSDKLITAPLATLGINKVPYDGNIFAAITPAFLGYLTKLDQWSSADFVEVKPLSGSNMAGSGEFGWGYYNWQNIKWIVHPELPGNGTNAEKCFMYHRNAVGHAADIQNIQAVAGYDQEQNYSYARTTIYHGALKLQNNGIVVINHDGSGLKLS